MRKKDGTEHDDSRIPWQEFTDKYGDVRGIGNFSKDEDLKAYGYHQKKDKFIWLDIKLISSC